MKEANCSSFPAAIRIDRDALRANARRLKQYAGDTQLMAVVKANGYGLGLEEVALTLWDDGIRWFGVARVPEALQLRRAFDEAGIAPNEAHIFSWLNEPKGDWSSVLDGNLEISVSTQEQLECIRRAVAIRGASDPVLVHVKVDTGMGRAGATSDDLVALCEALLQAESVGDIKVVGLWSHLSWADDPQGSGDEQTRLQIMRFEDAETRVRATGLSPELLHLSATSGTIWYPEAHFDLVRVGIGLYGLSPNPSVATSQELGLTPASSYRTCLSQVKQVEPGATVSYGATWVAERRTWLGLIPVGYSDGVPRLLSNNAEVAVLGTDSWFNAPIVGRVCMDQFVVDLGPGSGGDGSAPASIGAEVVLFGDPNCGHPPVEQWSDIAETINYEIIASLPRHLARDYVGGDYA